MIDVKDLKQGDTNRGTNHNGGDGDSDGSRHND